MKSRSVEIWHDYVKNENNESWRKENNKISESVKIWNMKSNDINNKRKVIMKEEKCNQYINHWRKWKYVMKCNEKIISINGINMKRKYEKPIIWLMKNNMKNI